MYFRRTLTSVSTEFAFKTGIYVATGNAIVQPINNHCVLTAQASLAMNQDCLFFPHSFVNAIHPDCVKMCLIVKLQFKDSKEI